MKITSQKFQQDLKGLPSGGVRSCLLYGPNGGLVDIITKEVVDAFAAKSPSLVRMYGADVEKNPSDFYNSLMNLSLFGDYQIIVVKDVSNKFAANIVELEKMAASGGADLKEQGFIVVTAGGLDSRSKLRAYYEKEQGLLSVPCYDDDKAASVAAIRGFFDKNGVKYSGELVDNIALYCGGDRSSLLNDLNMFLLYLGDKKEFVAEDVEKVFYDSQTAAFDEFADAVFDGSAAVAHALFGRIVDADGQMVGVVRSMIGHLKVIRGMKEEVVGGGLSVDEVVKSGRVFFKRVASYKRHLRMPLPLIDLMLYRLATLELRVKMNSKYDQMCVAIMNQAITSICANINAHR